MIAGQLEIQLMANVARLQADMEQAKRTVKSATDSMTTAVKTLVPAFIALEAAMKFVEGIKSIVAVRSALDDMSDTLGDNVKTLDGLRRVMYVTGGEMEQITNAASKLARNMNAMDDNGKAAGEAIKSLGLSIEDVKGKKPAEAMFEIAKALGKFEDGASKVAVAVALFGKEGAKLLPFLKDLAEEGELNGRITAEQAAQAEKLEKEYRRLKLAFTDAKDGIANDLIPWLTKMVEQMREGIRIAGGFADAIRLFGMSTLTSDNAGAKVKEYTADLKALQEQRQRMIDQGRTGFTAGMDKQIADAKKKIEFALFMERQAALANAPGGDTPGERARMAKPDLKFTLPDTKAAEAELKLYTSALQALENELGKLNEQTQEQKTLYATTDGSLQKLTQPHKSHLIEVAKEIDAYKQRIQVTKAWLDLLAADAAEEERRNAALSSFNESNSTALKQMQFENDLLAKEAPLATAGLMRKEDELRLMSQLKIARDVAIAQRQVDLALQEKLKGINTETEDGQAAFAQLTREAEAQKEKLRILIEQRGELQLQQELTRANVDAFKELWGVAEQTGKNAFVHLFSEGKGAFEGIGKALKASIIDVLYQMTLKRWMIDIGANLTGSFGAAGGPLVAGGQASLSAAGNLSSLANFGSRFSMGSASQTMADFGNYFGSIGSTTEAGGTFGLMDAIGGFAAANPMTTAAIVGLAVLGGKSIFGSHGTPARALGDFHTDFSSAGAMSNSGSSFGDAERVGQSFVQGLYSRFDAAARALGATYSSAYFGYGANTGENGQKPNFTLASGTNGRQLFGVGESLGSVQALTDQNLAEQSSRAILAALKGSQLPQYLAKFFDSLMPESMTGAQADAALAFAQSLKQIRDELTHTPLELAAQQVADMNTALGSNVHDVEAWKTAFVAAIDAGVTPEAVGNWQALGQALEKVAQLTPQTAEAVTQAAEVVEVIDTFADRLQAAKSTLTAAESALRAGYDREVELQKKRVEAVRDAEQALRTAYESQRATLQQTVQTWRTAAADLRRYRDSLDMAAATPEGGYRLASATFYGLQARARNAALPDADRLAAIGQLQGAGETLRNASMQNAASRVDYLRDLFKMQNALAETADVADHTADIAERQLEQLRTQVARLIDLNAGVLSVDDAIAQLQTAQQAADAGATQLEVYRQQVARLISIDSSTASMATLLANYVTARDAVTNIVGRGAGGTGGLSEQWVTQANGSKVYASTGGAVGTFTPGASDYTIRGLTNTEYSGSQARAWINAALSMGMQGDVLLKAQQEGVSLQSLAAIAGSSNPEAWARENGIPVYARGVDSVPSDGLAYIHRGERITPASRNYSDSDVCAEVRELRSQVADLNAALVSIAQNTGKSARLADRWDKDGAPIKLAESQDYIATRAA